MKILLSTALVLAGLAAMMARAEAGFYYVEPTIYVCACPGYTNPGYFSGVHIRIREPYCYDPVEVWNQKQYRKQYRNTRHLK